MKIIRVIKKELTSLLRDKGVIATMIVAPLVIMAVFGYTFQADIKNIDTIIINNDSSKYSKEIVEAINNSEYFEIIDFEGSLKEARSEIRRSNARAVFYIPEDFQEKLDNTTKGEVELYIDSSDYAIYNIVAGASGGVLKESLYDISIDIIGELENEKDKKIEEIRDMEGVINVAEKEFEGMKGSVAIDTKERAMLFNQVTELGDRFRNLNFEFKKLKKEFLALAYDINRVYEFGQISYFMYLTPAILTLLLFFIGIMNTVINIVEERNANTLYRIATTPLRKYEFLLGKFIAFLLMGLMEVIYSMLIAILLFDVKVIGSIASSIVVLILMMAASIGLGLLISACVRTARQAVLVTPLIIIPSVLISQTFSPIEVMPKYMQAVAYLSPMYYSNVALREIMIKGTSIIDCLLPVFILAIYAFITLSLGSIIYKKRIN